MAGGEPAVVLDRNVQYPQFLPDGASVVGQVEGSGRLEILALPAAGAAPPD